MEQEEKYNFEKAQQRQKLLHSYVTLSDKMEEAYRNKDFNTAKNTGLAIMKDANALKEDGTFEDLFKPTVNKRIADYAILMFFEAGIDNLEKELLKLLFTHNVMNMDYVKGWFGDINSFEKIEYAEQTFNCLKEIGVLTAEEAQALVDNARENDGSIL